MQKLNSRWRRGKGYKDNENLYADVLKYGWDSFSHEVLYSNLQYDVAANLEEKLILEMNLINPDYGYNRRRGDSHRGYSKETIEKMRVKAKSNYSKPENNPMYGRKQSDKSKSLNREFQMSLKNPNTKPVLQCTENGKVIDVYVNLKECGRAIGVDPSHIRRSIKDNSGVAHGCIWSYIDKSEYEYYKSISNKKLWDKITESRNRKINQYTIRGEYVRTFNNASEAQKKLRCSGHQITLCCRGEREIYLGFVWKYQRDIINILEG